jgi:hypothetical protein
MRRLLPLLLVALLTAGCLGGGAKHYTLARSSPCLAKHFTLQPITSGSPKGLEAVVRLSSRGHYVAFYADEKTAQAQQVAFLHQAARNGAAGSNTVERQGNAVVILPAQDRAQDSTIRDCLR